MTLLAVPQLAWAAPTPGWSDEFPGTRLDMSKWTPLQGGHFYTPPSLESYTAQNVTVANGVLHLHSVQQSQDGFAYTSGGISSKGKFAFTYGTIAVRAKLPKGAGIWPALWLMPADGSSDFEIDAMEAVGQRPNEVLLTNHWRNPDGSYQDNGSTVFRGPDFSADFHTFTVQWTPDSLTWRIDGQVRKTATDHIPNKAMFLYINTAIGALAGTPDPAAFPQTFAIDSVRVTPLAPLSAPITGGQLAGTVQPPPSLVDVTTEGTSDWTLWSVTGDQQSEQKHGTSEPMGQLAIVGSDPGRQSGGGGTAFRWSDGTTQPQGTSTQKGAVVCGAGNGFSLTVPADTTPRTLRFYVNVWHGQGLLQTSLSDGSAASYTDTSLTDTQSGQAGVFTLTYAAASAGQHLNVHWTSVGTGCIVAQGATWMTATAPPVVAPPVTVPTAPPVANPPLLPTETPPAPQPTPTPPIVVPVTHCITIQIFSVTMTLCPAP